MVDVITLIILAVFGLGAMWSQLQTHAQMRAHIAQMHELHAAALRAAQAKSLQELAMAEQLMKDQGPQIVGPRGDEYEREMYERVYGPQTPAGAMHETQHDTGPLMPISGEGTGG